MEDDAKKSVEPRLRFPELAEGWTTKPLKQFAKPLKERAGTSVCVPYTVNTGVGLVSQQEKFGRIIAGDSFKNYIVLKRNDFAYNKSATKAFPEGFLARHVNDERAAVPNSIFTCFRINDDVVEPAYLDFLFQANLHGKWLRKFIMVGARAHGSLAVDDDDLMALPVPLPEGPKSLAEQQKIADCLTSVDVVIAAQGRKVAALQDHKKGLMQQLFPREGDSLPGLRFPEFRDGPEWKVKPLSIISENLNNRRVPITENVRLRGNIPYYGASGVVDYVEGHIFDEDLLCVSEDGANLVARTYPIAFPISGKTWVNNHAHVLRFEEHATQKLVEGYLNSTDLKDFITGIAQPKLNRAMLDSIPIPLPEPAEQKAIAGCISSLDSLLAAELEKLDALGKHKKGLMQQLFPSSEGD
jgi:type I restriction enzyme S subunit